MYCGSLRKHRIYSCEPYSITSNVSSRGHPTHIHIFPSDEQRPMFIVHNCVQYIVVGIHHETTKNMFMYISIVEFYKAMTKSSEKDFIFFEKLLVLTINGRKFFYDLHTHVGVNVFYIVWCKFYFITKEIPRGKMPPSAIFFLFEIYFFYSCITLQIKFFLYSIFFSHHFYYSVLKYLQRNFLNIMNLIECMILLRKPFFFQKVS